MPGDIARELGGLEDHGSKPAEQADKNSTSGRVNCSGLTHLDLTLKFGHTVGFGVRTYGVPGPHRSHCHLYGTTTSRYF